MLMTLPVAVFLAVHFPMVITEPSGFPDSSVPGNHLDRYKLFHQSCPSMPYWQPKILPF